VTHNLPFDALLLDMDGVLLDTRPSFTAAVVLSARRCAVGPGLGAGWGEPEVEALRLAAGFNNDWDGAAAVALLGPASGPGAAWSSLCSGLATAGGGPRSVAALCGEDAWTAMRARVTPVFQCIYAGPRALEIYGLEPTEPTGLYVLESPLVSPSEIAAMGLPAGVFTGRAREEATLGLERLGFYLPPERVVCDTSPRFRKPRPDGLVALASAMNSRRPLYVGDTVDDMAAAWNAREAGLEVSFAGVAGEGSERARRFTEGGAVAVGDSLRMILSDLGQGSKVPRSHGSGGLT
jgi:HAD superfamily hydrolase (TIGR01549 family)